MAAQKPRRPRHAPVWFVAFGAFAGCNALLGIDDATGPSADPGGEGGAESPGGSGGGLSGQAGASGGDTGQGGVAGQGGAGGAGKAVSSCKVLPEKICSLPKNNPPPVLGRVLVVGLTDVIDTAAGGVRGEFGVGPAGSDPRVDVGNWAYTVAVANDEFDFADDADELKSTVVAPRPAGTYAYVYRFSVDDGPFTYCDTDGVDDFDPTKLGVWLVPGSLIPTCP